MSRLIIVLVLSCYSQIIYAQDDSQLNKRLEEMLHYTGLKDIAKIMDYTYPGLFKIMPKDSLKAVLDSSLNSTITGIRMDSFKTEKVFQKFKIGSGEYARLNYSIIVRVKLPDEEESEADEQETAFMIDYFSRQYGEKNVRIDTVTRECVIKPFLSMVAVKDEISPEWTFLNLTGEEEILKQLFSQEVITRLESFENKN